MLLKKSDVSILVFGDSIVYGTGDEKLCGWVNRLRLKLESNNYNNYHVFNLGKPGEISSGLSSRLENEIKVRFNENKNTIIIFGIGINDTQIIDNINRVELKEFINNINKIIYSCNKFSNNIICLGLTPVDETKSAPSSWDNKKSFLNKRIKNFDNEIEDICKNKNVEYLKVFDVLNLQDICDGIHPNSEGHEKICKIVLQTITKFCN